MLPAGKEGFERGKMDEFEMIFPSPGDISKISIGHDGKGFGAGWHLDKVEIVNLETADAWLFRCGRWLDSNPRNDGGLLVRALDLPERYVDEEVRQMREAEARAIEEAARLRTQDDDRSTVGSRPATAESKKGGAQRHAGALAGAGAASGPGYLQAAGEGSFTGPDGRSVSQSQSQSAPAPPPPASGVPRPRRLNVSAPDSPFRSSPPLFMPLTGPIFELILTLSSS